MNERKMEEITLLDQKHQDQMALMEQKHQEQIAELKVFEFLISIISL
jgi:hypothetical protein